MTAVVEDAIEALDLPVYARIPSRVAVKHASVFRRTLRSMAPAAARHRLLDLASHSSPTSQSMSNSLALTPHDPFRPVAPAKPTQARRTASPVAGEDPARKLAPRPRATRRPAPAPKAAAPQAPPGEECDRRDGRHHVPTTDRSAPRAPRTIPAASVAKGMTVAAALLELLQREDTELVELVESTQQRYDTARRRARRAA